MAADARAWDSEGVRELRRLRWSGQLAELQGRLPAKALAAPGKSAPWKVALAARLREVSAVPNGWLAEALGMGSGAYVSKHVGRLRREPRHPAAPLLADLRKVKSKA